ncbi:helix-turn-helix domain-containing protein [Microbacterium sp. NPDC056052]|uniref:helix-turn-helix domain-containing protein n=1 Tax=Microbacterium sp. NPDC056052 TaxID=3345695 RepID=UPI0035DCD6FF
MIRRVEHSWRLQELMAALGTTTISDLIPHLADRRITLSDSQLYRLPSGTPERINLMLLGAILDTLDCAFEEQVPVTVTATASRICATGATDATALSRTAHAAAGPAFDLHHQAGGPCLSALLPSKLTPRTGDRAMLTVRLRQRALPIRSRPVALP